MLRFVKHVSVMPFESFFFGHGFFSIGLHPLGARWIQEHFTYDQSQETFSYYGPINLVALNVGYHNEHHDFPSVPWNNLPKLRAMAPEFYDTLKSHSSWSVLLFQFIFDKRYSVSSRVERIMRTAMSRDLPVDRDLRGAMVR